MTQDDNYTKWSSEQVESYYVKSAHRISFTDLAKISGISLRTINRWKVKYQWEKKRAEFWNTIKVSSNERVAEQVTALFSSQFTEMAQEHLNRYKRFGLFTDRLLDDMVSDVSNAEDKKQALKKVDVKRLNTLLSIADRAMRGAGECVGLYLHIDANAAITSVENMGYKIIDPNESEQKTLAAEARAIGVEARELNED